MAFTSTSSPSILPATAACARRGPIASATSRTVEPSGTGLALPSGSFTVMSGMASSLLVDAKPPRCAAGRQWCRVSSARARYCLVLQYGQTSQLSLSALPHSMHGLRSFFMQYGQMRKSFSTGL